MELPSPRPAGQSHRASPAYRITSTAVHVRTSGQPIVAARDSKRIPHGGRRFPRWVSDSASVELPLPTILSPCPDSPPSFPSPNLGPLHQVGGRDGSTDAGAETAA